VAQMSRITVCSLFLLLVFPFLANPLAAQVCPSSNGPHLMLGAAWYPEQWPEKQWERDLATMQAAHINLVRVGEFAWSELEPAEGDYRFEWLDRAITSASRHCMAVVLATPTAAPPAWLVSKYPEVLRIEEDGHRAEHGGRQDYSAASNQYRALTREIARRLAERYGHNPAVVAWQIDNEFGYANPSFDKETLAAFHGFLRQQYGTIANLNRLWTTTYWSQVYDSFDEIPMHSHDENPGLLMAWKNFVSATWREYEDNQIQAMKPFLDARQRITTNTVGWYDNFDHYPVEEDLDFTSWDDYVGQGHLMEADNAAQNDLARGFKQKNFWVMETQPGFVSWARINNSLDRGEVRDIAWQAVGHGADALAYWQWRSALNGQEQYHGTLAGPDGAPMPVLAEISQIGEEFASASPYLIGTTPNSQVAMLHSYQSRWAIEWQRHGEFDPVREFYDFYRPFHEQAQSIDVLSPDAPLDRYRLVVAPALNVLPRATAQRLIRYVENGGNLVLGPRSGMKDEEDALYPERQPGPLISLLGGRVEQYFALEAPIGVSGSLGAGKVLSWAEMLSANRDDAQVLLRYGASNGWLDGQPALITRTVGSGSITYVGAWLSPALMDRLAAYILQRARISPILAGVPAGVEVCERSGDDKRVLILINHTHRIETVRVPSGSQSIIHQALRPKTSMNSSVRLTPYGVEVFSIPMQK